ncbi:myb-like protein A isoform X2 [Panonychus citri]|uniref:myb-like protein A isoform X2 n=1 Tax=Panonychus citri TaxID=50023 RepID=UPI002307C6C1|nr:myb-like protein A isoform X2 [Panonychus citri]
MPDKFIDILSSFFPTMFLVCKFHQFKRQQQESNRKKITEKELSHLNHKIDKLLNKLEEHDSELASTPDEECVICISAKATMQTFPCGHRVVCRKCFVKTIQVAVSQRLLPLRCVICRAKILRLKQTSQGGIDTGTVLRSHVAAVTAGHHHHHHHRSSSSSSLSSSSSSSSSPSSKTVKISPVTTPISSSTSLNSPLGNNPFFISPATSPVSPVTEIFREQRAVWARNYDSFGYEVTGQSPIPNTPSPIVSTPTVESKTDLNLGSGCVLHKHCFNKHNNLNGNDGGINNSGSVRGSPSTPSSSSSSKTFLSPSITPATLSSPLSTSGSTNNLSRNQQSLSSPVSLTPTTSSSFTPLCPTAPNPWQFQINRKRRHRLAHRRRRGHYVPSGRPTSLLLPIDEKDEWHEDNNNNSSDHEITRQKSSSLQNEKSSSSYDYYYRSKRKQSSDNCDYGNDEDDNILDDDDDDNDDDDDDEDEDEDEEDNDCNESQYLNAQSVNEDMKQEDKSKSSNYHEVNDDDNDENKLINGGSMNLNENDSRRDSMKHLLDTSQSAKLSPNNHNSKLSNAFARAKNLVLKVIQI